MSGKVSVIGYNLTNYNKNSLDLFLCIIFNRFKFVKTTRLRDSNIAPRLKAVTANNLVNSQNLSDRQLQQTFGLRKSQIHRIRFPTIHNHNYGQLQLPAKKEIAEFILSNCQLMPGYYSNCMDHLTNQLIPQAQNQPSHDLPKKL